MQRKHPIERLIIKNRENSQIRPREIQTKRHREINIIKTPKKIINQPFNTESTISEMSLRVKIKTQLLPKVSTSTHKRSKFDQSSIKKSLYSDLYITSNSWCLYDSNTKKYLGFRQDYRREMASLTKIMTTFLAIELIQQFQLSLNCIVKVTKSASEVGGTTAELQQNIWICLEDLLYGTMLPSGNDAAYCLAQYVGYLTYLYFRAKKSLIELKQLTRIDLTNANTNLFVQEFISQMNQKSFKLGLFNTRFSNPHGLQNALNTSSAKDIVKLSQQAAKNQLFAKIMNTCYYKYELFQGQKCKFYQLKKWFNTNKLLLKGWSGIKTGQTTTAGSCLSSLKEDIFITVLNSDNAEARFSDTQRIFNWYKNNKGDKKVEKNLSGIDLFCFTYNKVHLNRLPSMLTEISL